jgi:hypothetical protein
MLGMLYALTVSLQTRRIAFLVLGIVALTASFGVRLDAILALPAVGFTWWTVNRPYVGATGE